MPLAWRIVKESRAAVATTGEGEARFGGRWNSRGVRMVYASGTLSLAALEMLIPQNPVAIFRYVALRIEFEAALAEKLPTGGLPAEWDAVPPGPMSQGVGDAWVREGRSAVLEVPSVLIPGEPNYLLNPLHPDFRRILFGTPQPFALGQRLPC